jgi:hypothetical protein
MERAGFSVVKRVQSKYNELIESPVTLRLEVKFTSRVNTRGIFAAFS